MRYFFLLLFILVFLGIFANFSQLKQRLRSNLKEFRAIHWAWIILFVAIMNLGKIESQDIFLSNIRQILIILFAGIIIFIIFLERIQHVLSNMTIAVFSLMLYGLFGIISGLYSPFPEFSIYKATLIFLPILICLVVPSYSQPYASVKTLTYLTYCFYAILLTSFILGGIIEPKQSMIEKPGMVFGMLRGWIIITNPNTVGLISGALLLVIINRLLDYRSIKEKFTYLCFGLIAFVGLIMGQSRTCVAAFAFSLMILLSMRKKFAYVMLVIMLGLCIVTFQSLREDFWMYLKRGVSEKQIETWSGRLTAWKYSLKKFEEKPVLGYGMAAGVRFGAVSKGLIGSHLHSSYFEVLLNSGLLGFIPWFICLFIIGKTFIYRALAPPKWFNPNEKKFHVEMTILFIYFFIRSITGTTFVVLDNTFLMYTSFLAYSIVLAKKSNDFFIARV